MTQSKKTIGLFIKHDQEVLNKANELEARLRLKDVEIIRKENDFTDNNVPEKIRETAPANLFCVFVLGGDGTFLSAVRWIGHQDIPVLGVKFGEVGFLAEVTEEGLFAVADSILKNDFKTDARMRLQVKVIRNGKETARETVLNEMVVNKGALARLAHFKTSINEQYLTTYSADGLIVSTPTGSTAYSLAAGGPVVHPMVPGIILTPICPFTLTNRPLIIPETSSIHLQLEKEASDIMLTFDGQKGHGIDHHDEIIISKSPSPVRMITVPNQNYYDVLKAKLRWSGSRV